MTGWGVSPTGRADKDIVPGADRVPRAGRRPAITDTRSQSAKTWRIRGCQYVIDRLPSALRAVAHPLARLRASH